MTDRTGWLTGRTTRILLVVIALVTAGFIASYVWDNYFRASPSVTDRAIEHMEQLIRDNPNDPELRAAVADVYLSNGMYGQAIAQYNETLKVITDHKGALLGLGSAYMAIGREDEAIEYFNRVVELVKDSEMARLDKNLQSAYYFLGRIYLGKGEPDMAVENLENAVAMNPADADALYLLARAHHEKQEFAEAVELYNRAVTLVPNFKESYEGLAGCYESLGDEDMLAYAQGMVALLSEKYDEAVTQLQAAVSAGDEIANAYWGLGVAYEGMGQVERAKEAYTKAVALDHDHILARAGFMRLERLSSEEK